MVAVQRRERRFSQQLTSALAVLGLTALMVSGCSSSEQANGSSDSAGNGPVVSASDGIADGTAEDSVFDALPPMESVPAGGSQVPSEGPGESEDGETSVGATGTEAETTAGGGVSPVETTKRSQVRFVVPAEAVPIKYTFVKDTPLIEETMVQLTKPKQQLSMHITDITYGGVVCGFSFTGSKRPDSPQQIRITLEDIDGSVVQATLDLVWNDDQDVTDSDAVDGWNFLSDAQANRNGPGWVVQVGALPTGGGVDRTPPKQAVCELMSKTDITPESGPIAYWAGFAAV
jgi:hypothetical protein